MRKDFEQLFTHLAPAEPPAGLFDRIILAVQREQELRRTKKLVFGFLALFVVSMAAAPFSWTMLVEQTESSGILYFLSTAAGDVSMLFVLWQDFGLAVLESLPIVGITIFTANIILLLFTARLFLYRKRLLLAYLVHGI